MKYEIYLDKKLVAKVDEFEIARDIFETLENKYPNQDIKVCELKVTHSKLMECKPWTKKK